MAKVPQPSRGQPIDLAYIYQLAEAINDLSKQLSPVTAKYTTIQSSSGPQTVRTSDAQIIGAYETVIAGATSNEATFTHKFANFKYPPIVTATLDVTDNIVTDATKNAVVTITNITTGSVDGVVKFNTTGTGTARVNLIIIGIPK